MKNIYFTKFVVFLYCVEFQGNNRKSFNQLSVKNRYYVLHSIINHLIFVQESK